MKNSEASMLARYLSAIRNEPSPPSGAVPVKISSILPGESVNHYHPENFVIEVLRHAEEHLQALVDTWRSKVASGVFPITV